jgi:arylsulfatase A-like enzyme
MTRSLVVASVLLTCVTAAALQLPTVARSELVIVVDGLRPDYVTADLMPRLSRLGQRGIVFTAHHSVFPTVTRVNSSSFVTGSYPETHGLMGNAIYIPSANATRALDTGARENLLAVERAGNPLLTAPTLGEILQRASKRLLVVSDGTSGAAYLLNHSATTSVTIHPEFTRPADFGARVEERLGAAPDRNEPNAARHRRVVDAYLTFGVDEIHPDVAFMWFNDPDSTAHARGVGTPPTREALAAVDQQIGRVEDALSAKRLLDRTNIVVTSDHGFSTHTGALKLDAIVRPFARTLADGSSDIVVAEGAIYFRGDRDPGRVRRVVAALQQRPEVGAIFTRDPMPGTLPFDVARWNHARSGDILVSADWTREKNEAGFAGMTADGGVAGHGTSSPFDVHNVLIAAGPDFKQRATSDVPTGNVDIAPTLLRLLGMTPPPGMTGRVIEEGLRTGPAPSTMRVDHSARTAKNDDTSYSVTAHISTVADRRYLDYTEVFRQRRTDVNR